MQNTTFPEYCGELANTTNSLGGGPFFPVVSANPLNVMNVSVFGSLDRVPHPPELRLYVGVEEFQNVGFPEGNVVEEEVVAIGRSLADCRIKFEDVGFVEAVEFGGEGFAGSGVVIVGGMDDHDGHGSAANRGKKGISELGGAPPRIGGWTEGDCGADRGVTAGHQERKLAAKRMTDDGDPTRVHQGKILEE